MSSHVVRVGAVADLHYRREKQNRLKSYFEEAARRVDILLLGGDLTDFGQPDEAEVLARDLAAAANVPIVAVLGNHDFEAGREQDVIEVFRDGGIRILDGEACEIKGVGIVGTKGFGGGFGRGTLEPWGESMTKQFVQEAVDESLKLERALARLRSPSRIALLHYSPIRETVVGEPDEIHPFLGSGRLEEPLNRFGVAAVFHGHAHRGTAEGRTSTGIPVFNVSLPVLRSVDPNLPLRIVEIPVADAESTNEN
ncbi:MAG: metallophosphoesterase [Planctomycetaceae bacterium]